MKSPALTLSAGGWERPSYALWLGRLDADWRDYDWHDCDWDDIEYWHDAWRQYHANHHHEHLDILQIGNDVMDGGFGADLMWGDGVAIGQFTLTTGIGSVTIPVTS